MRKLFLLFFCLCLNINAFAQKSSQKNKKANKKPFIKLDPKEVIINFFHTVENLSGYFVHIVSSNNEGAKNEEMQYEGLQQDATPTVWENGDQLSGLFKLALNPTKFKWKYVMPVVRQINKEDEYVQYKEGQGVLKAADGVEVKEINWRKPITLFQSLPFTFIFEIPVEKWINDMKISVIAENEKFIHLKLEYKQKNSALLKQLEDKKIQLIFSKKPLCLVQWMFTDAKGKNNQVTLFSISINKRLKNTDFQID